MNYRASPKLPAISSAGVFHGAFFIYISLIHTCIPIYSRDFRTGTKYLTCLGIFTLSSTVSQHLYPDFFVWNVLLYREWHVVFLSLSRRWHLSHFWSLFFFPGILRVHIVLPVLLSSLLVHLKLLSSLIFAPFGYCSKEKAFFFPSVSVGNDILRCP
jgi:hypothetical protein